MTELRKIAEDELNCGKNDDEVRRVLADYLRLTDPTPLNVLQVAAWLEQDDDNEHDFVDADNPTSLLRVTIGRDHVAHTLRIGYPTVGLLYAAQRQEATR